MFFAGSEVAKMAAQADLCWRRQADLIVRLNVDYNPNLWTTELKAPIDPLRDRNDECCAFALALPFGRC